MPDHSVAPQITPERGEIALLLIHPPTQELPVTHLARRSLALASPRFAEVLLQCVTVILLFSHFNSIQVFVGYSGVYSF